MSLALLLPLLGSVNGVESDAALVLRSYDLAGVLPRTLSSFGAERLFPHVESEGDGSSWGLQGEDEGYYPDFLVELIRIGAGEEFDLEGRWLQVDEGPRLVVRASEAAQKRALEQIQAVDALFTIRGELLVDVLRSPTNAPANSAAVLSSADAEKLLASAGGARASYRLEFRPREFVGIDATGTTSFVADYNVEIAQAAAISDPVNVSIRPGTRLQASCSPAPGGTWIALTLRSTDPIGRVRELPIAIHGQITTQNETSRTSSPRSIQSVALENRSLAINTFLAEGKALVLRTALDLADHQSNSWIVVRVGGRPMPREQRLSAPDKDGRGEVRAYPIGFAAPAVVQSESRGLLGSAGDGIGERFPVRIYDAGASLLLVQFVRPGYDSLLDSLRSEQEGLELGNWGAWMIARAAQHVSDAPLPNFDLVAAGLARGCPSPRTFQIAVAVRRGGSNGQVVARTTLVARSGTPSTAVLGREETRVIDYDVEVAQNCSAADPQVEIAFEGLALRATPLVGLAGETRLELLGRARIQRGPAGEFDSGSSTLAKIAQAEYDELQVLEWLSFDKDGPRVVRFGDASGGSGGLLLEVEMAEVR